jgi:hypothetical protein
VAISSSSQIIHRTTITKATHERPVPRRRRPRLPYLGGGLSATRTDKNMRPAWPMPRVSSITRIAATRHALIPWRRPGFCPGPVPGPPPGPYALTARGAVCWPPQPFLVQEAKCPIRWPLSETTCDERCFGSLLRGCYFQTSTCNEHDPFNLTFRSRLFIFCCFISISIHFHSLSV